MNEKHFGVRMPLADYEVLAEFAGIDRSTVAQQVRQAVAEYIRNKQKADAEIPLDSRVRWLTKY